MAKNLKNYSPDYVFLFTISGLVLIFDQSTKWIVRQNLSFSEIWIPIRSLAPYLRIINWRNTGAAFGIFQEAGSIFAILAILVALAILIYFPVIPKSEGALRFALALQMGGAVGNLVDRLTQGWVTDFVSIGNFPVFNVADASIFFGVVILLLPYVPQVPEEMAAYFLLRRAREINNRGKKMEFPNSKLRDSEQGDDILSLGVLENLFQSSPEWKKIVLNQRAKRIHQRFWIQHKKVSKLGRQPKVSFIRSNLGINKYENE